MLNLEWNDSFWFALKRHVRLLGTLYYTVLSAGVETQALKLCFKLKCDAELEVVSGLAEFLHVNEFPFSALERDQKAFKDR